MFRKAEDFLENWNASATGTLDVMKAISDDKMDVSIVEGHSSLGWLAWHLVGSGGYFGHLIGLQIPMVEHGAPVPDTMAEIVAKYEEVCAAFQSEASKLTDAQLEEEINGFAGPVSRGKFLHVLIDHQNHHRGQMTVLLRQAGLTVPGVMGPTKEMQGK